MATSIRELPLMEQLAIEQAVFSHIGDDVSTKNPDSLRSACDETVINNYYSMGAKSYDVHVRGEKVGTYSVRLSKEKVEPSFAIFDRAKFAEWIASEEGRYYVVNFVAANSDKFLKKVLEEDGTVPDGVSVNMRTVPPAVMGTTLRVSAEKIADAINGYLPTSIFAFLTEGGSND